MGGQRGTGGRVSGEGDRGRECNGSGDGWDSSSGQDPPYFN